MISFIERDTEFLCPNCKSNVNTTVQISCSSEGGEETVFPDSEVTCNFCDATYSVTIEYLDDKKCEVYIIDELEGLLDGYEEDFSDLSSTPERYFAQSIGQLKMLLQTHGTAGGDSMINRMIFMQAFSVFEAFLCDTLIFYTVHDDDAIKRLIAHHKEIRTARFSAHEVFTQKHPVRQLVVKTLKGSNFHNLGLVKFLYATTMEADIYEGIDQAILYEAVTYRHDCVHRNGHDVDGSRLRIFDRAYLFEIIGLMEATHANICKVTDEKYTLKWEAEFPPPPLPE